MDDRLACVRRTWTPAQLLHPGTVAWAAARGDGSPEPDARLAWGDPLHGFADVWLPGSAILHLAPDLDAASRDRAVDELLAVAPHVALDVSDRDTALRGTLGARGFRAVDGPWFATLWRRLDGPVAGAPVPGYEIRPVRPDEVGQRVAVHRSAWAPARIRTLLGLPLTGDEGTSRYDEDRHGAARASPLYQPGLDLVAVARDGSFAAYGLGWFDEVTGSVLLEPVGTDPAHARRGLARAVCAAILEAARGLGATQAVVGARGDDGYPVPRRLYAGLGMRPVARTITLASQGK